jgi:hypothetical protein
LRPTASAWSRSATGQQALATWLAWRAQLAAIEGIPKNYELHATRFANGRGNPSLQPG